MMTRRALLALVAVAGASLPPTAAVASRRAPGTGLGPVAFGKPPPDFNFATASGPASLRALRGHAVVINFWATFCEPCISELTAFARLPSSFGDRVILLSISDEPLDKTQPILSAHGVQGHNVCDFERTIFERYGVTPIPTTLVIAPDGNVAHVSIGELDWPELEGALAAVHVEANQA